MWAKEKMFRVIEAIHRASILYGMLHNDWNGCLQNRLRNVQVHLFSIIIDLSCDQHSFSSLLLSNVQQLQKQSLPMKMLGLRLPPTKKEKAHVNARCNCMQNALGSEWDCIRQTTPEGWRSALPCDWISARCKCKPHSVTAFLRKEQPSKLKGHLTPPLSSGWSKPSKSYL